MPLPPALAARLAKRGIINKSEAQQQHAKEEVFAESYDKDEEHEKKSKSKPQNSRLFMGYPGCPNKWNAYHDCEPFCLNTYGSGRRQDDLEPDYKRRYEAMRKKYCEPLPDDWKEHFDPGTGRHFYWCTRTDKVSWLPPGHPKAKVTEAASRLREVLSQDKDNLDSDDENRNMDLDSDMSEDASNSDEDDSESESDDEDGRRRRHRSDRDRHRRDRDRDRSARDRDRRRGSDRSSRPDPMDPSSYSDAPKGTWSSGLHPDRD